MNGNPSVLALRPGAKLSKVDRSTLLAADIVVVQVAPEDLVAIQSVSILPVNDMLRLALQTLNASWSCVDTKTLRADFARRLIETYLALGEADPSVSK